MSDIQSILLNYQPITLAAMDEVALMERVDEKFTVSLKSTLEVLSKISDKYYCLEIDRKRLFNYQTEYFDNDNKTLFKNHQNGKLNRYKIRFRDYIESKKTFLEVKFKNNKKRTIKSRIKLSSSNLPLNSCICLVDNGIIIRDDALKGTTEMIRCMYDLMSMLSDDIDINYFTDDIIQSLLNWDAEKYRQQQNIF